MTKRVIEEAGMHTCKMMDHTGLACTYANRYHCKLRQEIIIVIIGFKQVRAPNIYCFLCSQQ